jgi:glycine cleavage system H protein
VDLPTDLQYTEDHEWIRLEGDVGTIGITDYAQGELTDIVFVELPEVGDTFGQGDSFGTIEAIKAVSDLFCPLDGTIVEINEELSEHPEWVNDDAYGEGWMIKIQLTDTSQAADLLSPDAYEEIIG